MPLAETLRTDKSSEGFKPRSEVNRIMRVRVSPVVFRSCVLKLENGPRTCVTESSAARIDGAPHSTKADGAGVTLLCQPISLKSESVRSSGGLMRWNKLLEMFGSITWLRLRPES